jgi:hypothetical protein
METFPLCAAVVSTLCASMIGATTSAPAAAAPTAAPVQAGQHILLALNPAYPEHAAILRWQHALLSNDFNGFLSVTPPLGPQPNLHTDREQVERMIFDSTRKYLPATLFITSVPDSIGPNGARDYTVFGCTRIAGDPHEIRLASKVLTREIDGQWKAMGFCFSPPWTNKVRACPVVPGPV